MKNVNIDKKEHLNKIVDFKRQKKYKEAIKLAFEGFKHSKDNCFLNEACDCYTLLNKKNNAIKILKKMLKNKPDDLIALKKLGYIYYTVGNYKNALEYFKSVVEFEPLISSNYFNLGCIYHFLKNYNLACINYTAAIQLNNSNISALNNKGMLHYENGEWEKAIPCFKQAINYSKNHPEAYHHMGIIYREYYHDYELSELYIKKAIELDPKFSENYYQAAITYQKENKSEDAINALKQCININPKHRNALNLLKKLA